MVIKVKWLGRASFKLNVDGKVIYIDPYEGEYNEKADIILSTHHHQDHCDVSKIALISKEDTTFIVPQGCASKLQGNIQIIEPKEKVTIGNIIIEATSAYNQKRFRTPGNPWHPKGEGIGFLLSAQGKIIYHAGDTDFIPEMKELKNIDLALIPSGGTYTMDNKEAAEAVLEIKPKVVIPMHYWDSDPVEFKEYIKQKNTEIKVAILKPGEEFKID